jgi:hypothetical protein
MASAKIYLFLICLFAFSLSYSQNHKKSVSAERVSKGPEIDGKLDDVAWQNVEEAQNFVMFKPGNGDPEPAERRTTVKTVYDDQAIYFGVYLYDDQPDLIPKQFGPRDDVGQVDLFQVSLNPNNDGQNDTDFVVMSTGVQADSKTNASRFGNSSSSFTRKDYSWSAVWYSKTSLVEDGWIIEMKIPYSALRFANTAVQTWGINFQRLMHRHNEHYSWNYMDKSKGEIPQYAGELTGIENIKPPTRLNFSPYASTSYATFDGASEFNHNLGMDLKFGINEGFTLDATLIPDFSQVAFDDQILNLSPFEEKYDEQRPFFTEGTELFEKARIFYSRRIGNTPVGKGDVEDALEDEEEILDNPNKVNMLNAVKVSGRTKKGLGIGFFNAITEKTSAKIKNTTTDEVRTLVTEPVANYNVLVLDQQFNKNSSVSLINTSVIREGMFRDANVTAIEFDISTKNNKYNLFGNFKTSSVTDGGETSSGYTSYLNFSKTFGNIQFDFGQYIRNKTYDIKDLGFQTRNNFSTTSGGISYQIFEPTNTFERYRIELEGSLRYLFEPNVYYGNELELDAFFMTNKRFAFGMNIETNLGEQHDYYEPRADGRYFSQNGVYEMGLWISTDYRKKFAADVRGKIATRFNDPSDYHEIDISPRYRFSDKFELIYSFEVSKLVNERAWVDELEDQSIIFGNRDIKNITNEINSQLSFNTKSTLSLAFRHYWSPVVYDNNYYLLTDDGHLIHSSYRENHNINYNIWNFDLNYSWEFAPGSELVALYRNSIFNSDELSHINFTDNLENLFKEPIFNSISLKFIYYLDYNAIKSWF